MALKVLLAATLRKYVPAYDHATGYAMEVDLGVSIQVREVARRLAIPEDEVRVIMVNGVSAKWDTVLHGDERVAFFPPVGGG